MTAEEIIRRLESILADYQPSKSPYRYRGMSERGASEALVTEEQARDDGRGEVCEAIQQLLQEATPASLTQEEIAALPNDKLSAIVHMPRVCGPEKQRQEWQWALDEWTRRSKR